MAVDVAMAIDIGDIVQFADVGPEAELGRVCKDNGMTACVFFKSSGCLRVRKCDLMIASGNVPECPPECKSGC